MSGKKKKTLARLFLDFAALDAGGLYHSLEAIFDFQLHAASLLFVVQARNSFFFVVYE